MLGKTNIMAIEGGTTASGVKEYRWVSTAINGITGTFVKAVFENDILVGIAKDGTIAYTSDGENWETTRLNLEQSYEINDIIWDGSQFVMVGGFQSDKMFTDPYDSKEKIYKNAYTGIIATTVHFDSFHIKNDASADTENSRYWTVRVSDGKYRIHCTRSSINNRYFHTTELKGTLDELQEVILYVSNRMTGTDTKDFFDTYNIFQAGTSIRSLVYFKEYDETNHQHLHIIKTITDTGIYNQIKYENCADWTDIVSIFECKDSLYYCMRNKRQNYELGKIISEQETSIISINTNYSFVDGIYYDKAEIFINSHQMLVVRKGENIADKTMEDLVDITYDFSMTALLKAFDKIYIFGSGGNILVSSDEINSEESLAVKTMSARKALYDAKTYTDQRWAELEARIAVVETKVGLTEIQ